MHPIHSNYSITFTQTLQSTMNLKDACMLLDVVDPANIPHVRGLFLSAMRVFHPDRGGSLDIAQRLTRAYGIILEAAERIGSPPVYRPKAITQSFPKSDVPRSKDPASHPQHQSTSTNSHTSEPVHDLFPFPYLHLPALRRTRRQPEGPPHKKIRLD